MGVKVTKHVPDEEVHGLGAAAILSPIIASIETRSHPLFRDRALFMNKLPVLDLAQPRRLEGVICGDF